jgi:hypothetical protein
MKGEIKDNAFDKMKGLKSSSAGSTVFKYKDFFIKTRYSTLTKNFSFMKFTD